MSSAILELVVLLDRSGSMQRCRDDHEGGLRSLVRDQRRLAGDVRLTFVRFDSHDPFELVFDGVPLEEVQEDQLTLIPRGNTPLLSALGLTIEHVAHRLKQAGDAPDQVVLMVITDGHENASHHMERKFTKDEIRGMIAEKEKVGWKVLYLGANVDAFAEAAAVGIAPGASMGYAPSGAGVGAMYCSSSSNLKSAREARVGGMSTSGAYSALNFLDEQRAWALGQQDEATKRQIQDFLTRTRTTGGKEGTTTSSQTDKPQQ